jgi:hypothetical protein
VPSSFSLIHLSPAILHYLLPLAQEFESGLIPEMLVNQQVIIDQASGLVNTPVLICCYNRLNGPSLERVMDDSSSQGSMEGFSTNSFATFTAFLQSYQ